MFIQDVMRDDSGIKDMIITEDKDVSSKAFESDRTIMMTGPLVVPCL